MSHRVKRDGRKVFCLHCGWKGTRLLHSGWAARIGKTFKPCPKCGRSSIYAMLDMNDAED